MATIDELTGLPSRPGFDSSLAALGATEGWLLYADVDKLRLANLELHFTRADRMLREIGRLIVLSCPSDALVARYGGDEILVYLTADKDPAEVAERMRAIVEANFVDERATIVAGVGGTGQAAAPSALLTLSIGIAKLEGDLRAALAAADFANQRAKVAGANCVVMA
jgi:diguanylate cyclase (GGDEF)-like protein